MKVVTVTVNPAIDKTLLVPDFRFERVVRVQQVFIYPSGKGVNVARVLTRLGTSAICLGFVGGYAGAFLRDGLTREGIPHDFTTVSEETRTNITLRDPAQGLESHLVEAGARVTPAELNAFLQTFQRHLQDASWVALCGSLPPGVSSDFYAQLIHLAHHHSVPCALDTSGEALREGLAAVPALVKPNRQELAEVMDEAMDSDEQICAAIQKLLSRGIRYIVVSLGKEGAIGSDSEGIWEAKPPPVSVVNTVGSGDALLGGLLHALLQSFPFPKALAFAVAVGTANTLTDGPGYVTMDTVQALWQQVKVQSL